MEAKTKQKKFIPGKSKTEGLRETKKWACTEKQMRERAECEIGSVIAIPYNYKKTNKTNITHQFPFYHGYSP